MSRSPLLKNALPQAKVQKKKVSGQYLPVIQMSNSNEFPRDTFHQYVVDEPTDEGFSELDRIVQTKNSYALPSRKLRKSVLMKKVVDRADIDE